MKKEEQTEAPVTPAPIIPAVASASEVHMAPPSPTSGQPASPARTAEVAGEKRDLAWYNITDAEMSALQAITQLKKIQPSDIQRKEAFDHVLKWIESQNPSHKVRKLAQECGAQVAAIKEVKRRKVKGTGYILALRLQYAIQYANIAITALKEIQPNESDRDMAFEKVVKWINEWVDTWVDKQPKLREKRALRVQRTARATNTVPPPAAAGEESGCGIDQTGAPDKNTEAPGSNSPPVVPPSGVQLVAPDKLRPHPLNQDVYGDEVPDEGLVESVRTYGILDPLQVTPDNTVLSGHRRLQAASTLGLETVPVNVVNPGDPLRQEEHILEYNRYREKNNEQRIREYIAFKRIEAERAKPRKGTRTDLVPKSAPGQPVGKARDLAAAKVGIAGSTAALGEIVVQLIDKAKRSGNANQAKELRETLNRYSINTAYKHAQVVGLIPFEKISRARRKESETKSPKQAVGAGATGEKPAEQPAADAAKPNPQSNSAAAEPSAPASTALGQSARADAPAPVAHGAHETEAHTAPAAVEVTGGALPKKAPYDEEEIAFPVADGSELSSRILTAGWIGAEWVAKSIQRIETITNPVTPMQKQGCAKQQRVLIGLADILNREMGMTPSSEDLHNVEDVLTTLRNITKTHQSYKS